MGRDTAMKGVCTAILRKAPIRVGILYDVMNCSGVYSTMESDQPNVFF